MPLLARGAARRSASAVGAGLPGRHPHGRATRTRGRPLAARRGLEIARLLRRASGMIDFVNVIGGRMDTDSALAEPDPGMGAAARRPSSTSPARSSARSTLPVFHAARITDLATARHAIAEGMLDMVGMTRAHIADPHIVAQAGGAARRTASAPASARATASTGSTSAATRSASTTRPPGARRRCRTWSAGVRPGRRKVVVVGRRPRRPRGRPRRGRARATTVVLFEAADRPGGQVKLAARSTRRREIIGIVDWLRARSRAPASISASTATPSADDVLAEAPDIVVIATGGMPEHRASSAAARIWSPARWDVLSGQPEAQPARSCVYDDNGQHPGPHVAEFLAAGRSGSTLRHPRPDARPRSWAPPTPRRFMRGARTGTAFASRLDRRLNRRAARRQRRSSRRLGNMYTDATEERPADHVVVEHGTAAGRRALLRARSPRSRQPRRRSTSTPCSPAARSRSARPGRLLPALFRVGDAVASRNIHAAIFDSLRLMKDL